MSIAEILGDHLEHHGITQDEAADALGVKQPTVNRWLSGAHTPSVRHIPALVRFTGLTERQIEAAIMAQQKQGAGSIASRVAALERGMVDLQSEVRELLDEIRAMRSDTP